MRATFLAGPLGNSPNSSLVEAPVPVVIRRSVGALPELAAPWRQNSTIFQWAGVSAAMPSSFASSTAISLVHSPGTVIKPSSLTCTVLPAIVRVAIVFLLLKMMLVNPLVGVDLLGLRADDVQHAHGQR